MIQLWNIDHATPRRLPLNEAQATSTLDALTLSLPRGLYTTFRTFAGRTRVLGLSTHLNRLYRLPNAAPGIPRADLRRALAAVLQDFPAEEARVRVQVDTNDRLGALYLMVEPLKLLAAQIYQNGVAVTSAEVARQTPSLKSTAFIEQSAGERKSMGAGIFEVLLTHHGRVLEGMTSNFYWIQRGVVCTARRGVLAGVTRQLVLRTARAEQIPIRFERLTLKNLAQVDEAFITSSSRGIVPVVQIDSAPVGDGTPGALTRQLMQLYEKNVNDWAQAILPRPAKGR
jgi:branched-chain amino acid aminotransferase